MNDSLTKNSKNFRYYSLARYAFLNALLFLKIKKNDKILLPAFICKDMVTPIVSIGAKAFWYDVDENLNPILDSKNWPVCKIVLMVNYFGFEQNFTPFKKYQKLNNAIIIEDNAHGYLSKAHDGIFLGTRADLGIFSYRKTLRIPDGASLYFSERFLNHKIPKQLPFEGVGLYPLEKLKLIIIKFSKNNKFFLYHLTIIIRNIRKLKSLLGKYFKYKQEGNIKCTQTPYRDVLLILKNTNNSMEIKRRRRLYVMCLNKVDHNIFPIYEKIYPGCAPYGFPFRSNKAGYEKMEKFSRQIKCYITSWPELANEIKLVAPKHYTNVNFINFLN